MIDLNAFAGSTHFTRKIRRLLYELSHNSDKIIWLLFKPRKSTRTCRRCQRNTPEEGRNSRILPVQVRPMNLSIWCYADLTLVLAILASSMCTTNNIWRFGKTVYSHWWFRWLRFSLFHFYWLDVISLLRLLFCLWWHSLWSICWAWCGCGISHWMQSHWLI